MIKLFLNLIAILLISSGVQTHAALVVSIDLDPSTAGIQSTINGSIGSPVNVDVVVSLGAPADSLAVYSFSVRYNTIEFDRTGGLATPRPTGWTTLFGGSSSSPASTNEDTGLTDSTVGQYGEIVSINAESPGFPVPTGALVGPLSFVAASFTLTPTTTSSSGFDVTAGNFSVADGFLGQDLLPVDVTFNPGTISVTAVPEPSSTGLAVVAFLAGVRTIRRRR